MLHFLHNDLFRFVFEPQQLVESSNKLKWIQSSGKLLIHPLIVCPIYSLTNVVGVYSIT